MCVCVLYMECNNDVKITSLCYYATIIASRRYWKFARKFVKLPRFCVACLYGGKQVGGND